MEDGVLFQQTQQCCPVFTFYLPRLDCMEGVGNCVYQAAERGRRGSGYGATPWEWELRSDHCRIDAVIAKRHILCLF